MAAASPRVSDDLVSNVAEAQRAPALLAGVAALALFFVPQTIQLFPAPGGLQLAKVAAVAVVFYLMSSRRLLAASR